MFLLFIFYTFKQMKCCFPFNYIPCSFFSLRHLKWTCLPLLLAVSMPGNGETNPGGEEQTRGAKVFVINHRIADIAEFRKLVSLAERLKPYGKVQINIGTLAGKGFYEMPEERRSWHDYATNTLRDKKADKLNAPVQCAGAGRNAEQWRQHEDCFLLGPDLAEQVQQKRQVMRNHPCLLVTPYAMGLRKGS